MEIKKLTISELESYYNLIQVLIDETIRYGKMNMHSMVQSGDIQRKLNKYNEYRDIIINEIKSRFDETFSN